MRTLVPSVRASIACWLASGLLGMALAQPVEPSLTAAQLVEKNAKAKGGLEAWQKIRTMAWTGYAVGAGATERKMSFLLEQQRPASTRFEIMAEGQKSVRVFSANDGWKMRASSGGKPELQTYSPDELRFAQGAHVIDGPLMDFVAKGNSVTLVGHDVLEGRGTYLLEVKTPEGDTHRIWLDAETFLELRLDRSFHNSAGKNVLSTVMYRDYRLFEGLQIPVVWETATTNEQSFNRLVIERVALNPPLDANTFVRPAMPVSRRAGAAMVDTRAAASSALPKLPRPVSPP
jgi:hypothetical protein